MTDEKNNGYAIISRFKRKLLGGCIPDLNHQPHFFMGDGKLWLKMNGTAFDDYCLPGWLGRNLYIPVSDPYFHYYHSLLVTALAKKQQIRISNISVYNGTTACDITQTGYGIVVLEPETE